jgi:hypothetical protein
LPYSSSLRSRPRIVRGLSGDSPNLKKKITNAERAVQREMLAMLEWASKRPGRWLKIGNLKTDQKAAELLEKRGVIEIWKETGLYRLKPQK